MTDGGLAGLLACAGLDVVWAPLAALALIAMLLLSVSAWRFRSQLT